MRPSLKTLQRILIPLACVFGLIAIANAGYFRAHAAYYLNPPEKNPKNGISVPNLDEPKPEPNTIQIPSLGIQAPIKEVETVSEDTFQLALREGVVHYPGTALPGLPGNVYLFGHSSDYSWAKGNYKTVFALLPKIQKDAEIILTNADGTPFTYRVTGTQIVGPKDTHVLDQQGWKKHLLTVQTSYPLGTALKRFLVFAELVETAP